MTDNNAPESTGRIMKMTKRQAAFFIGEVFYTLDKGDQEIERDFLKNLIGKMTICCDSQAKGGGSFMMSGRYYNDLLCGERVVLVASALTETIEKNDVYQHQFQPLIDSKDKEIKKDILRKNEGYVLDLLREDEFTKAISSECSTWSLDGLQNRIHTFAVKSASLFEAYRRGKETVTQKGSGILFKVKKPKPSETMPVLVKNG